MFMNSNYGNYYLEFWFSSSISKEKHIPKNISKNKCWWKSFQSYYLWGNDFSKKCKKIRRSLRIEIMETTTLNYDFLSVFLERNIMQKKKSKKNFDENFCKNYLWGNDFSKKNKKIRRCLWIEIMETTT